MRTRTALVLALTLGLELAETTAHAHGGRNVTLDVTATSATDAVATFAGAAALEMGLRGDGCVAVGAGDRSLRVHCPAGIVAATLEVTGFRADGGPDLVVARLVAEDGDVRGAALTARSAAFTMPGREPLRGVLTRFARLGVEHVLGGVDHVLFLLALVWQAVAAARGRLARAARELAGTATAFTLAHTLTLTTTALGLLRVPTLVAEACIAASLVLVALDVKVPLDTHAPPAAASRSPSRRERLALASAFGLVHGLGFATALAGGALPEHALALGLGAFNAGVEAGQAVVLASALGALALARALLARAGGAAGLSLDPSEGKAAGARALTAATSWVVGVSGAFLLVSRVAAVLAARASSLSSLAP